MIEGGQFKVHGVALDKRGYQEGNMCKRIVCSVVCGVGA